MGRFYRDRLGAEQKRIFQKLVDGENVFLTGNAGTGKSFLVEAFSEHCNENGIKLLKSAPTGVASCNIKGVTLHKLFGLKTDVKSMLKEEKELPEKVGSILNLAGIVLIDEISMVRLDVFDKIMRYIELENNRRREQKRKDIQLILVGDFFQLAPVIPPADKEALDLYYGCDIGNGFAFQSKYWQSLKIQFEKLTEIRRQDGDKEFCTALDQCKEGDTDCLPFFATETAKVEGENAIWVCGKNATALEKNLAKLSEIQGEEKRFYAEYDGEVSAKDKLCEETFTCKKGARVLMLINEPSNLYQNGSTGTIVDFEHDGIWVDIDKKTDSGEPAKPLRMFIKKHEFSKFEYVTKDFFDEITDERGEKRRVQRTELVLEEVGKAIQYPMKLGFAITIHKAQGQTYDEMNLEPEIFQDGQLYVALSRCRFANKLYIATSLNPRMVRASQEVVNYYKNPENYTFFGREKDIISVQVARECEGAVKLLARIFAENKAEVIDLLKAIEKRGEGKPIKKKVDKQTKIEPIKIEPTEVAPTKVADEFNNPFDEEPETFFLLPEKKQNSCFLEDDADNQKDKWVQPTFN